MYTLISSLTLLGAIIGSASAHPTQSILTTQPDESLNSISDLYTPHRSQSGTLSFISPQNLGVSFPFTTSSTCPAINLDWSCISHDLLSHLLKLYPSGPTSSPYYTIQHHSSSSGSRDSDPSSHDPSDTILISETVVLPTSHADVSFRSTLHLSISIGDRDAVSVERIGTEDWRSLMGLLLSANEAVVAETRGERFGKLIMAGVMPLVGAAAKSERRRRYAPSDIVFPYFVDAKKNLNEEEEEVKEMQEEREGKKGLKWSAEWFYYGVVKGADGAEKVVECGAMPDVPMWVEDEERKEHGVDDAEIDEQDWKIDL
ncbi:hypothetical protein ACMFMG_001490 [Clarireedia jacksonii]